MDACIPWAGTITRTGYGLKTFGKTSMSAHRWVWIEAYGPIPSGLQLDHLCRNRSCVNLDHLEPVTAQENCRRAKAVITQCPKGHPLEVGNLVPAALKKGQRACQTCNTASRREREETIRQAVAKLGIGWREYIRMYGASAVKAREIIGGE